MSKKGQILVELAPLFAEAKEKGLWFQGKVFGHDEILFSPKELREYHDKGKYIWGAVNWELVDPTMIGANMIGKIGEANQEYQEFLKRVHDND